MIECLPACRRACPTGTGGIKLSNCYIVKLLKCRENWALGTERWELSNGNGDN